MNSDMKKSLMIVLIAGVASLLIGTVAFSFGRGEILSQNGMLASFLGRTPLRFGMTLCLIVVLGTIALVPSVRATFLSSYNDGSNYRDSHKRGRGGKI